MHQGGKLLEIIGDVWKYGFNTSDSQTRNNIYKRKPDSSLKKIYKKRTKEVDKGHDQIIDVFWISA